MLTTLLEIAKELGVPVAVAAGAVGFVWVLLKFIKKIFEDRETERKALNSTYIETVNKHQEKLEENQEKLISLLVTNQEIIKENQETIKGNQEITKELAIVVKNNSEVMLNFSQKLELFSFELVKK